MARPHPARWAVQNRRNVHKQLDTAIEGTAVDYVESNVGVPVVDPVRTGACCDNRKDDHAEAVDETGFQEGAAQGKAAHRGHVVGALVFHVPHDLDSVLADESRVWPRQGASNPQVRMPIRLSPQVAKSAPGTLSRWRHGFKSRWDYLTLRCANQRRNLVRGKDLLPAHHAKLLHQEPDECLLLLRHGALEERLEVPGPLGNVMSHG